MNDDQAAILWWRQLFSEMGSVAHRRTPGAEGEASMERAKGLRNLFFKVSRQTSINLLLEIGAHNAETSRRFVRIKPEGRAVAYEASREVFERTSSSGLPAEVTIIHSAVGGQNGTVSFFVPEDLKMHHWSSLRKRMVSPVPTREVQVQMVTLDEAGRASGAEGRNTALWIDVEGAGLEVLQSGRQFITDKVAMLYMELSDIETYEKSNTSLEIIKLLLACGFVPVARDNQYRDAYNLMAVHSSVYTSMPEVFLRWMYLSSPFNTEKKAPEAAERTP